MPKRLRYFRRQRLDPCPNATRAFGKKKNDTMVNTKLLEGSICASSIENSTGLSPVLDVTSRFTFILDNACLRKGFVRKISKILNYEEDADFLVRQGKNLNDYHPAMIFEALKGILDSRLNRFDMVGAIYVKTDSGILLEIKPHVRIPRSFKRFCGIMMELLDKSCIRAADSGEILMRIVDGPLMSYLPDNARVIGLSYNSNNLVDLNDYVNVVGCDCNFVFVVGAMPYGEVIKDYITEYISVSNYPLSTRCCISLICDALEQKHKIF